MEGTLRISSFQPLAVMGYDFWNWPQTKWSKVSLVPAAESPRGCTRCYSAKARAWASPAHPYHSLHICCISELMLRFSKVKLVSDSIMEVGRLPEAPQVVTDSWSISSTSDGIKEWSNIQQCFGVYSVKVNAIERTKTLINIVSSLPEIVHSQIIPWVSGCHSMCQNKTLSWGKSIGFP